MKKKVGKYDFLIGQRKTNQKMNLGMSLPYISEVYDIKLNTSKMTENSCIFTLEHIKPRERRGCLNIYFQISDFFFEKKFFPDWSNFVVNLTKNSL
jgi:hypothetical protein